MYLMWIKSIHISICKFNKIQRNELKYTTPCLIVIAGFLEENGNFSKSKLVAFLSLSTMGPFVNITQY